MYSPIHVSNGHKQSGIFLCNETIHHEYVVAASIVCAVSAVTKIHFHLDGHTHPSLICRYTAILFPYQVISLWNCLLSSPSIALILEPNGLTATSVFRQAWPEWGGFDGRRWIQPAFLGHPIIEGTCCFEIKLFLRVTVWGLCMLVLSERGL